MKKRGFGFWDVIAWIILAAIAVWLILKATGIINTPVLLEYAPIFGVVYLAGWAMHKLETAVKEIEYIRGFNQATVKEITQIKEKCIKNHSSR